MTPARFRKLVLALEGVEERPHMDRAAFRTTRKIFATLGQDKRVNLKVEPIDKREAMLEAFPDAVHSLGGWTRLGWVALDLAAIDDELLVELVTEAWRDAQPVKKVKKVKKKTKPKR
jgi:hypothetical protein